MDRTVGAHATGDGSGEVLSDHEHSVVAFQASRVQARLVGSVLGPTVLLPGPEQGWQALATLPGAPPSNAIASAARFGTEQLGMDEPPALCLHRNGSTRRLIVPVSRSRTLMRTWDAESHQPELESELLDELARCLVTIAPDASLPDVMDALGDDRGDGQPLADLVRLLGLPACAVGALETPEALDGQILVRDDKKRHLRDYARARTDELGPITPVDTSEMRFGPEAFARGANRLFGVVWGVLGVITMVLGVWCLLLGLRPPGTVLGLGYPALWVLLGAALTWFGQYRWRRSF